MLFFLHACYPPYFRPWRSWRGLIRTQVFYNFVKNFTYLYMRPCCCHVGRHKAWRENFVVTVTFYRVPGAVSVSQSVSHPASECQSDKHIAETCGVAALALAREHIVHPKFSSCNDTVYALMTKVTAFELLNSLRSWRFLQPTGIYCVVAGGNCQLTWNKFFENKILFEAPHMYIPRNRNFQGPRKRLGCPLIEITTLAALQAVKDEECHACRSTFTDMQFLLNSLFLFRNTWQRNNL